MKNEKIKEFLTKIAQEEGFKVEFLKLKEKVEKKGFSKKDNEKFISECLLPWSKKLGYKLSKKDFIDFDRMQKPTEITGLSPVELENVSGGGFTMLFALFAMFGSALAGGIGGGDSTNKNQKKGQDSCSTSLTQYQQADSGETTLAMLRDGHQINDIILDAYMHPQDGLPDSPAGSLDWDGYSQGAGTTRPTAQKGPTGIASMDYDLEYDGYEANYGETPADFATGTAEGAGTTTPTAPQGSTGIASMDYGIGETPADFGSGTAEGAGTTTPTAPQGSTGIASMDYYEANYGETPADFATGTAEGAGTTTPTAPQGSTGIASMDYYEANYGETPADFGSGAGKPMSTALVTTPGQPQISINDYNENYARTSRAEFERHHGTTSAEDYDQDYARTSPGDYDQNYVRSARPQPHTFSTDGLSSENGVHTEKLGNPLSVPDGVSADLSGSFNTGSSQQPRLAGNFGNGSTDTSSTISLDTPEGLTISRTSSGGQEIVNMMKDISAAENANFKAFEKHLEQSRGSGQVSIYTGLDSSDHAFSAAPAGGESMSTALVTTPGQPQTSVSDYNEHFARSSEAVDSGENVIQMLKDIKNPKAPSDAPNTDSEPQVGLNPTPEILSGTPADAPPYQRGQVSIYTGLDATGHPYSSAQKVNPKVTSGSNATQDGQSWKDIVKGTAQMTGIAAGLGAAAIGSVYAAGASQKNANKAKETTAKTENKKATKETKKDGNDFMRSFRENLQKNSPEASQYLNSLKY